MAGPTTQNLKSTIDGAGIDKNVEGFDLGLSTLGTDDEAAGTPNTPQQVATAIKLETARPKQPMEQSAHLPTLGYPAVWSIIVAFAFVIVVLVLAVFTGR